MSLPRPIRPYHFQADLIWWDGPFNLQPHLQIFQEILSDNKSRSFLNVIFSLIFKWKYFLEYQHIF